MIDFVGQTDRLQRAAWALRIIDKRERAGTGGGLLSRFEFGKGIDSERIIDGNFDPAFFARIIENGARNAVAVLFEQQSLEPHLDPIRRPGLGSMELLLIGLFFVGEFLLIHRDSAGPAFAILDRDRGRLLVWRGGLGDFSEIEFGGEGEAFA